MFSPLSISTRGWLSPSTSKALTLSTIGWLVVHQVIGGGDFGLELGIDEDNGIGTMLQNEKDAMLRIKRDAEDIINIIKIWTRCQG